MDVVRAILDRVDGGSWPAGWVLVSCQPECEPDLSKLLREIARDVNACVLFTPQQEMTLPLAVRAFCLPGHEIIPALRDILLPSDLFRSYVVLLWDEVGPPDESWSPVQRAAYLFRQVREMRVELAKKKVTIFAFACSPRAGGRGFQSEVRLRLHLSRNHAGTVLTVDGKKAIPGLPPVLAEGADDVGF